ncbi:hypothetical protein [Mycolicibacterium sp.]|uniref:hypothetical protein n=1 Tax=Mycolicibacterium sp. TaxID=2320850 RepID=UPI0035605E43
MTDIAINSREQFQQVLTTLGGLRDQITAKAEDSAALTTAADNAASAGVVASQYTSANAEGSPVAAAYSGSVSALGATVGGVKTAVEAASSSLQAAITDLQSLLKGLSGIDDQGAIDVKKV